MILLVACTDNELQRAEREQFGRKDADQEPAGGSGFVVFFHVAQVTVGADMAAAGESAAFDFDRHAAGRNSKVETPFPCRVEMVFHRHVATRMFLDQQSKRRVALLHP